MFNHTNCGMLVERIRCPVCATTDFDELYRCGYCKEPMLTYLRNFYHGQGSFEQNYLTDAEYVLLQCKNCNLIFQKYVPDKSMLQVVYARYISPSDELARTVESYSQARFYADAQEIANLLKSIGKPAKKARILDYGMGFGRWALVAQAMGCDVFGSEIVEYKVKYAQSRGIKIISNNEIVGMEFDLINTEQVFEHLCDPLITLRTLTSGLHREGVIKISVPRAWSIKKKIAQARWSGCDNDRLRLNPISPLEHLNCFAGKSLQVLATSAGLRPARIVYGQLSISFDRRELKDTCISILGGRPFIKSVLPGGNYRLFRKGPA